MPRCRHVTMKVLNLLSIAKSFKVFRSLVQTNGYNISIRLLTNPHAVHYLIPTKILLFYHAFHLWLHPSFSNWERSSGMHSWRIGSRKVLAPGYLIWTELQLSYKLQVQWLVQKPNSLVNIPSNSAQNSYAIHVFKIICGIFIRYSNTLVVCSWYFVIDQSIGRNQIQSAIADEV